MKRMERTVEGFSGRIVRIVGDELMATFPHADEALQAAVEMQQRIAIPAGLLADTRQILFAVLIDQDHEIQT